MEFPTDFLEQFNFVVRVGEDGDVSVKAHVMMNKTLWTAVILNPVDLDDTDDPTSGSPEFFKRLLLEGHLQLRCNPKTKTIELY
jgi:hypothetical protein